VEVLSTLSTTISTAGTLIQMARFVENYSKRGRLDSEAWTGIDRDQLKDLAETLNSFGESWGGGGWDDDENEGSERD
jgi:hypothetical protein